MAEDQGTAGMLRLLALLPAEVRGRMVASYTEQLTLQLETLEAGLRGLPSSETQALAHRLAGSAAMMQDRQLAAPALAMERALRESRLDEALAQWPAVQRAAARSLEVLGGLAPLG